MNSPRLKIVLGSKRIPIIIPTQLGEDPKVIGDLNYKNRYKRELNTCINIIKKYNYIFLTMYYTSEYKYSYLYTDDFVSALLNSLVKYDDEERAAKDAINALILSKKYLNNRIPSKNWALFIHKPKI